MQKSKFFELIIVLNTYTLARSRPVTSWGDPVLPIAYRINRRPLKPLVLKNPLEILEVINSLLWVYIAIRGHRKN